MVFILLESIPWHGCIRLLTHPLKDMCQLQLGAIINKAVMSTYVHRWERMREDYDWKRRQFIKRVAWETRGKSREYDVVEAQGRRWFQGNEVRVLSELKAETCPLISAARRIWMSLTAWKINAVNPWKHESALGWVEQVKSNGVAVVAVNNSFQGFGKGEGR